MMTARPLALALVAALACQPPQQGAAGDSPRQATPPTADTAPPTPPAKDAPPTTGTPPAAQPPAGDLASTRAAMLATIGQARCTGTDQCRTIPVGVKPCGGPRGYLAYSVVDTDTARLADLVAEFARLDLANNRRTGEVSDCSVVPRPIVTCQTGRCTTGR